MLIYIHCRDDLFHTLTVVGLFLTVGNFIERDGGKLVNRTEAIANLGGSALDNEECYLLSKLTRALGVVYLEHHARI